MFNIESLSLSETTELQLRHPATDELLFADEAQTKPIAILVYGKGSKKYRNAILAVQNRHLKRSKTKEKVSAEQLREEGIDLLVACSDKAINFDYKGAPVDSAAAFRELYNDPAFDWIKDQVDAGLGDVENFLAQ